MKKPVMAFILVLVVSFCANAENKKLKKQTDEEVMIYSIWDTIFKDLGIYWRTQVACQFCDLSEYSDRLELPIDQYSKAAIERAVRNSKRLTKENKKRFDKMINAPGAQKRMIDTVTLITSAYQVGVKDGWDLTFRALPDDYRKEFCQAFKENAIELMAKPLPKP